MKNNKLWYYSGNIRVIIIIIFILLVAGPFFINEAYKINSGYETIWGASEVLSFYGAFLSFVGTVALGAVALWQNEKANKLNERLIKLEKERFKLALQPFVLITDWKIRTEETVQIIISPKKLYFQIENECSKDYECACLSLLLTNTSNAFVLVNYSTASVYQSNSFKENWSNAASNQPNPKLYLNSGETGEIVFYCSKEKMKSLGGKKICIEFILENRYSVCYKETVDIIITTLTEHKDKSWYTSIHPQNYQIHKFINVDGKIVLVDEDNEE